MGRRWEDREEDEGSRRRGLESFEDFSNYFLSHVVY